MKELKLDFNYKKLKQCLRDKNCFLIVLFTLLTIFAIWWVYITSAPINNNLPLIFEVEEGASLKEITQSLKDNKLIHSRTLFNSFVILKSKDSKIISGEYLFTEREDIFQIINRITTGDYGIPTKQIRVPEGATIEQIGELFEQEFENFDKEAFYQLTEGQEGYLFPDTYNFLINVRTFDVVETLSRTFNERVRELEKEIGGFDRPLDEIIIMASIIEKEADADSKEEVADILWKRIEEDMLLQVDATFVYSINRGTFDLTMSDLTNEDNPYNTYVFKGLPPTAISNPGIESIHAAATPEETPYFYFLTGRDGNMYYASTFEEHKQNRYKYLD